MRVHVAAHPDGKSARDSVIEMFSGQREQRHVVTESPVDADIILFVDGHLHNSDWRSDWVAHSELARRFPRKVTVYDERDLPWCRYPGIYVSMPAASFHPNVQIAAPYWQVPAMPTTSAVSEADLLFSFVGSPSVSCREDIYRLSHPGAIVERITGFTFFDPGSERFEERKAHFADVMSRSRFILCPRGRGVSSIRLYEAMAAGRVPVIIADEWVPPAGPEWSSFSVRWPEGDVAGLPVALEALADQAPEMAARARAAYEAWVAPDVWLTRQLDQLQLLRGAGWTEPDASGYRDAAWRTARSADLRGRARSRAVRLRNAIRRR